MKVYRRVSLYKSLQKEFYNKYTISFFLENIGGRNSCSCLEVHLSAGNIGSFSRDDYGSDRRQKCRLNK